MNKCEVCGNSYDKLIEVKVNQGVNHLFDSFECAIHKLAPKCQHCEVKIVGHGVQAGGQFFCCAHCAQSQGHRGVVDNADKERDLIMVPGT